jgi:type IV secretion system protein VirB10
MSSRLLVFAWIGSAIVFAQAQPAPAAQPAATTTSSHLYTLEPGTKILLNLINSVSTKSAAVGDRVYLETAFPVLEGGRVVVPTGSYVTGTITQVKRAGRVKGRAELFVRFDTLTFANGVMRDFRGRTASLDGDQKGKLDREEGTVHGDTNKGGDAAIVATTTATGAMIGGVAAGAKGLGIGAGAGAAAGLIGVLASRGPEAVLERGSTMEMLLDRQLQFKEDELMPPSTSNGHTIIPASTSTTKPGGWPGTRPWPHD